MNDKNDLSTPLTSSPISSHACGQTVWRFTMCAIKVYMEMSHICVVTMLFACVMTFGSIPHPVLTIFGFDLRVLDSTLHKVSSSKITLDQLPVQPYFQMELKLQRKTGTMQTKMYSVCLTIEKRNPFAFKHSSMVLRTSAQLHRGP